MKTRSGTNLLKVNPIFTIVLARHVGGHPLRYRIEVSFSVLLYVLKQGRRSQEREAKAERDEEDEEYHDAGDHVRQNTEVGACFVCPLQRWLGKSLSDRSNDSTEAENRHRETCQKKNKDQASWDNIQTRGRNVDGTDHGNLGSDCHETTIA